MYGKHCSVAKETCTMAMVINVMTENHHLSRTKELCLPTEIVISQKI